MQVNKNNVWFNAKSREAKWKNVFDEANSTGKQS